MKNIQPEPTINNTTPNDSPSRTIPNGFAQIPHWLARDSNLSMGARLTWILLEGRQGNHAHARVGLKVLSTNLGVGTRSVKRFLSELTQADLLSIKRTGRTNIYVVLKRVERGHMSPIRGDVGVPSTEQEVIRNKKASLENNILDPLACFAETTISPRSTTPRPMRKDNLQPAAAAFESLRIGLFLDQLDTQGIQKPEQNRKISEILTALFAAGWKETDLIKELKRRITNPNARKGLTVTELQSLANTPKRLPHPAPAPISQPTRSEHQYEELEEAWVKVSPQEQADQYEESLHDWISIIRTDLKQRKRIG